MFSEMVSPMDGETTNYSGADVGQDIWHMAHMDISGKWSVPVTLSNACFFDINGKYVVEVAIFPDEASIRICIPWRQPVDIFLTNFKINCHIS